jgi:hypothetical protein
VFLCGWGCASMLCRHGRIALVVTAHQNTNMQAPEPYVYGVAISAVLLELGTAWSDPQCERVHHACADDPATYLYVRHAVV